jgi:hypothetical protein
MISASSDPCVYTKRSTRELQFHVDSS